MLFLKNALVVTFFSGNAGVNIGKFSNDLERVAENGTERRSNQLQVRSGDSEELVE